MRHDKAASLIELARAMGASAEGLTLDEMAEVAGVGRRTVERMRDALEMLFPQMEAVPDGQTRRFRIPGGLDGFLQSPTTEELVELGKAARKLREDGAASRAQALESLERKVRSAVRNRELRRLMPDVEALARAETIALQAGPRPFEDEALIAKLRQALMAMRAVRFVYKGGSRPGAKRTVAPYGLMFGRANYLVALEEGADEARNWRLDRIEALEVTDTAAGPPPDFSLSEYANRSFGIYRDAVENVVLRILPEGREDALGWRFHPTQTVEPQDDGSVIVRFSVSGMRELAWHLFTWGGKVEIVSPRRLKQTMLQELETALSRHRG